MFTREWELAQTQLIICKRTCWKKELDIEPWQCEITGWTALVLWWCLNIWRVSLAFIMARPIRYFTLDAATNALKIKQQLIITINWKTKKFVLWRQASDANSWIAAESDSRALSNAALCQLLAKFGFSQLTFSALTLQQLKRLFGRCDC